MKAQTLTLNKDFQFCVSNLKPIPPALSLSGSINSVAHREYSAVFVLLFDQGSAFSKHFAINLQIVIGYEIILWIEVWISFPFQLIKQLIMFGENYESSNSGSLK